MFHKVLVMVTMGVVGVAAALPEDGPYGPVSGIYGQPDYRNDPLPYQFAYAIKDDYEGAHYQHNEKSDGSNVQGSYTVALPDGREQTVSYVADPYNGYLARVTYKGQAQHPNVYGSPVTFRPATYRPATYGPANNGPTYRPTTYGPDNNGPTYRPTTYGPANNGPTYRPTTYGPDNNGPTYRPTTYGPDNNGPITYEPDTPRPVITSYEPKLIYH
ncbi:adhesive plaque matrix protein-like [Homarus americanus]|uniref:adhesive plaque matrix protein-like n=1 Tax=Homarus americanus TaxID=6706 RepID=UPI001C469F2A|nr:adhesive plaque matrix protein-like [Homarus americanus]XP_042234963.1 adhesive plaque matrix protein-like [Homarus americanus]